MRAVAALRALLRSVVDAPARHWLAGQDRIPGGPRRLSRGIEPAPTEATDARPVRRPVVAAS